MSDHIVEDGAFINSIVGEGTRFRGELDLNGLLRIDGDYSGVIRTPDKVLVGKNGRAECTIYAGEVVIGGVIKGDVYSNEKVIIRSTGMVIGNIYTPRLIVEEGVILNGTYKINKNFNPLEDREKESGKEEEPVTPASEISNIRDYRPHQEMGENTAENAVSRPEYVQESNQTGNDPENQNTDEGERDKEVSAWNG